MQIRGQYEALDSYAKEACARISAEIRTAGGLYGQQKEVIEKYFAYSEITL